MIGRVLNRHEALLGLTIVVLAIALGIAAPQFFSAGHLFNIARGSVVIGMMALGLLVVLISGGIDVSVSATAVSSMYVTVVTLQALDYQGPIVLAFLGGAVVGTLLGLVNGVLVSRFRLPTLIVTLGTLTLYRGALLFFVGTNRINDLPAQMDEFAAKSLLTVTTASGARASLSVAVGIFALLAVALAVVLHQTRWGRAVYAIGGSEEAARRHGVRVAAVRLSVFALAGALAGVAGVTDAALIRTADPFTIVGAELDVLAAVVLGGASIAGGRGTVLGAVLGVLLISMVSNSLVLVGIPSEWQKVFIGMFLLLGIGVPAIRRRRAERATGMVPA